jgi:hypothetical protein
MDDRHVDLLLAIARQAVRDYRSAAPHRRSIMPATTWLRLAGLLDADGELRCSEVTGQRPFEEHGRWGTKPERKV